MMSPQEAQALYDACIDNHHVIKMVVDEYPEYSAPFSSHYCPVCGWAFYFNEFGELFMVASFQGDEDKS